MGLGSAVRYFSDSLHPIMSMRVICVACITHPKPHVCVQVKLAALGYKFQFITLAGFHSLNYSMFSLAHDYARHGGWQ